MILKTTKNHSQKIGSAFFVEAKKNDFMKDIGAKRERRTEFRSEKSGRDKKRVVFKKIPSKTRKLKKISLSHAHVIT